MSMRQNTREWVNLTPKDNDFSPMRSTGRRLCTHQVQRNFFGQMPLGFAQAEPERGYHDAGFEPRKRILAMTAPNSCLTSQLKGSAAVIGDNALMRKPSAKRRAAGAPPDALDQGIVPTTYYEPPFSKRFIAHAEPDTYRVLNTDNEPLQSRSGLRCEIGPTDELTGSFVGNITPKVDRGLRCHFSVPQTLSFKL